MRLFQRLFCSSSKVHPEGGATHKTFPSRLSCAESLEYGAKKLFQSWKKGVTIFFHPQEKGITRATSRRADSLSFGTGKKGTLTRSRLDSEQPLGSQVARTKTLLSRGPFAGKWRYWEGVVRGPLQARPLKKKGGSLGNPAASECVLRWKPGRWVSSQSPWVPGDAAWAPVCALQVSCASRNLNRSEKTRCWEWGLFYSLSPPRSLGIGMLV